MPAFEMSSRLRNSISDVVKSLGSLGSKPEKRISECLPPADRPVTDRDGQLKHYNGWHVFASEFARNNFISTSQLRRLRSHRTNHRAETVLILLSENGTHDLSNLTFDNFYNRAYDGEGNIWYTASVVAMDDYNIRHAIMASSAGATKASAFRLLQLDIEIRMGALLRDSSASGGGISRFGSGDLPSSPPTALKLEDEKPRTLQPVTEASVYSQGTAVSPIMVEEVPPLVVNTVANSSVKPIRRSFTLRY